MIFIMMVVLKRTYTYILMRFLSVCALVFAVGIAKVQHIDAASIDTTSIQTVFSSANVTGVGNKKLAVTCYSQGYYQSYYQSYYQGSYGTTFPKNVSALQNLYVNGAVSKGSGSFVIDHPLDPRNKLLYHSFVESPDMKNVYDGIADLDSRGEATIELPLYFLALNKDFRYLTTPFGNSMPNLYLASGVKKKYGGFFGAPSFTIAGGVPNGRISWQVTGIRHDPFAVKRPVVVEVSKDEGKKQIVPKGEYLHPDAYAQ